MLRYFYLLTTVHDFSRRIDEVSRTDDSHITASVHALALPHTVFGADGLLLISQKCKGQIVFVCEFEM